MSKHFTYNPYFHPDPASEGMIPEPTTESSTNDMSKLRKPVVRRTIDYHTTLINYLETRCFFPTFRDFKKLYPSESSTNSLKPIPFEKNNISHGFCTKYVSTSINKHKCGINCLIWSPDGGRLITGNAMGQFTLWNGTKFNFDTILQAHEHSIRKMIWKYDDEILVSSDTRGYIKYWTMNMKNLQIKRCHNESINDMAFSPTFKKFCTASADGYVKIWDFAQLSNEQSMKQHGWDVTCIDWDSTKSLIFSGSKDNLIKLWCPRSGKCLTSLNGHKNTISCLKINRINGNWLISGSKDQLIKLWDIRMLSSSKNKEEKLDKSKTQQIKKKTIKAELTTIRANIDELSCLQWHPFYEKLFISGGKSGDIIYWKVGNSKSQAQIYGAHDSIVWDIAFHPMGHILASASNDQTTKFWTRNRPGDALDDQYNVAQLKDGDNKKYINAFKQLKSANYHNPTSHKSIKKLEECINEEDDDMLINNYYYYY